MKTTKQFLIIALLFAALAITAKAQTYRLIAIQDGSSNVFEIDPNTGNTNFLFNLPFNTAGLGSFADYNPADGCVYIANATNGVSDTLVDIYKLDFINKTAVRVKQFTGLYGAYATLFSISFTPAGDLYVYCEEPAYTPGHLYKVEWSTGVVTAMGSTGTPTVLGLAYDSTRNVLWALENYYGALLKLNPTNAANNFSWYNVGGSEGVKLMPDNNLMFGTRDVANARFMLYSFNATTMSVGSSIAIPIDADLSIAVIPGPEWINLRKAVYVDFSNLRLGTNYQLQTSTSLTGTWTNFGSVFTATNSTMNYSNYWNVSDWNQLFFRLQVLP
jgi:hypothetical protein